MIAVSCPIAPEDNVLKGKRARAKCRGETVLRPLGPFRPTSPTELRAARLRSHSLGDCLVDCAD